MNFHGYGCNVTCGDRANEDEFAVVKDKGFFADDMFPDNPEDMANLLTDTSVFVRHLNGDPCMVDAFPAIVSSRASKNASSSLDMNSMIEAEACRPMVLDMSLPQDHATDQAIQIKGPHGNFKMMPPEVAKPGDEMHYYLGPLPEFRIEVPPDFYAGSALAIVRDDGSEVKVVIPDGRRPGDTFNVEPPALMVLVPMGVTPGEYVRFSDVKAKNNVSLDWYWAKVPALLRPGGYFVARLPPVTQERRV